MRILSKSLRGVKEIGFDGIENLLRTSDFISVHLPLIKKTKKLISSRELSIMKTNFETDVKAYSKTEFKIIEQI